MAVLPKPEFTHGVQNNIDINSASLMIEESGDDLEVILRILDRAGKEWATPVNIGEWWDREGLLFHTILQMSEDEMPGFRSRLEQPRFEIGIL